MLRLWLWPNRFMKPCLTRSFTCLSRDISRNTTIQRPSLPYCWTSYDQELNWNPKTKNHKSSPLGGREGGSMRFITLSFLALMACAVSVNAQLNDANEAIERGNSFFHRGQYELAIFEYRGALNWPGAHQARARFNIGVCKHRLGLPREAVADYRVAVKLSEGQFPSAFYALGVALQDLRRYQEAREAFAQAVKSSGGKHAEALFSLALESQRAGDDRAAFDHYREAIAQSRDGRSEEHTSELQ